MKRETKISLHSISDKNDMLLFISDTVKSRNIRNSKSRQEKDVSRNIRQEKFFFKALS